MRDELASMTPRWNEKGIVNLDTSVGSGTHWVAYSKKGTSVSYFDSFGLRPPPEVTLYFKGSLVFFSNEIQQSYDTTNCGHLCLNFLIKEDDYT